VWAEHVLSPFSPHPLPPGTGREWREEEGVAGWAEGEELTQHGAPRAPHFPGS
jgi:hypothetical protein